MRSTQWKGDLLFQVLFYLLCAFYILIYMPYGFEGTDTGYIFGSSWNIYNGQFPHRDFIYTRPAIPAYFHTVFIFLSENYGYLIDRSFFYIQIFFYSFLGAKLLANHFKIISKSALYFIAILGAVISIHNYPPMAWNTVDGVFFCMIGIYLLLKENSNKMQWFLGSFFVVLGVFCKQSFYFMPIFLFGYLVFQKDFKRLKFYSLFGAICVLLYFAFKYFTGSLIPFFEQTFVRTDSSAFVGAGIKAYYLALKFNLLQIGCIILCVWVLLKFISGKYVFLLVNLLIAISIALSFYHHQEKWSVIEYVFQLWFMGSVAFAFIMVLRDRSYLLLLLLLSLSWCAAISNGYKTPIHFSLPFVFSLYLFFFAIRRKDISSIMAGSIVLMYLVTFYFGYQTLYRESPRKELNYHMGEVFPQLKFIKSDKDTYLKYKELKILAEHFPNFTVVPSGTHMHYLTHTINPMGTDWPHNAEINNQAKKLVEKLQKKNVVVFVENSEFSALELQDYEIKNIIENEWHLIERAQYFNVYSPNP